MKKYTIPITKDSLTKIVVCSLAIILQTIIVLGILFTVSFISLDSEMSDLFVGVCVIVSLFFILIIIARVLFEILDLNILSHLPFKLKD